MIREQVVNLWPQGVCDKVRDKYATNPFVSLNLICVVDFHDLCRRQSPCRKVGGAKGYQPVHKF